MHDPLATPVKHRVGAAAARKLGDLGIETVADALAFAPRRYYHWGKLTALSGLSEGDDVTVLAQIVSSSLVRNRSGNGVRLVVVITDGMARLTVTFFAKKEYALNRHRQLLQPGETFLFAGKVSEYKGAAQLLQPQFEEVEADSPEAVARQSGQPIPIYPAKAGMPSWKVKALIQSLLAEVPWDSVPEIVPKEVQVHEGLLSISDAYQLLHAPKDDTDWKNARRTLAWREALVLQAALLQPRALGKAHSRPLSSKGTLVDEVLDALPFTLTKGQSDAWAVISSDLDSDQPMQRLLQADVGAGKTVLALLTMLRAVENGGQAALLAPTEVLANQHLVSLLNLLGDKQAEIPVHLLTASISGGTKNEVLARLASGEACMVVGTHALIQDGVDIPKLDVLVVDEQHRFGVAQRERLREGRANVPHLLVMTATPIPRTIAMTVFGDLDVTAMTDMPPGRTPVQTFLVDESNKVWMERIWARAREEIDAGGRVYVVCPRIEHDPDSDLPSIESVSGRLEAEPALEGVSKVIAHGGLKPEENAKALAQFASGESPLLLATTVIEVGVDVPEATMMVILGAGQFGLSQLHQLRGRVGRADKPSVAMLVHSSKSSPVTMERLQAMKDFSDGFALAEVDLKLRREGDVLGRRQSGGASSLQFLSVRRDAAIITAARKVATEILESDPSLLQHASLKNAVEERTGQEIVWLERN
jgi:RecG-like helicase